MNALWQCAVCVNNGGRSCTACGAAMTRRSAAVTALRSRIAQTPPPPPAAPLPEPVQRAINREPVDEEDWPYDEHSLTMMPLPGGCLFTLRPRQFGG